MSKFKPTQQMIAAAEAVFLAMATVQTVEPIVTKYQKEILANGRWRADPNLVRRDDDPETRIILDPKLAYLLPEPAFQEFLRLIKLARDAAGLQVSNDDQCPLLVAEDELRKANRSLIESLKHVTGLGADKLLCAGLAEYKRYTDLSLKLLAPFVRTAPEILIANAI